MSDHTRANGIHSIPVLVLLLGLRLRADPRPGHSRPSGSPRSSLRRSARPATASLPRWSPWLSSLARFSATTIPAAPPSPDCWPGVPHAACRMLAGQRRLLQSPAAAARHAPSSVGPGIRRPPRDTPVPRLAVPRSPRRHRGRLDREHARYPGQPAGLSPNTAIRSAAAAFRSPESSCCCRWPPAVFSTRRSAPARGSSPASMLCSARCTDGSSPAIFCWPTPTTARSTR